MKFKLDTSGNFYRTEKKIPLEELGFKFDRKESDYGEWYKDWHKNPTIEIKSLEQLVEFVKKWGEIVFDGETIEIYDDYRE